MIRQTSRQRREVSFEWERLRSECLPHDDLPLIEEVNNDIFQKIVENHRAEWNDSVKERIAAVQISMGNVAWSRRFVPHQKELFDFPSSYKGDRHVGRSYGSTLATLPSKVVNTLYKDTHRYLDAKACFPTILCNLGSHLDLDALKGYVVSRDEIFTGFMREHQLSATIVKSAVNSMIGSCPRLPIDFGLGPGRDDAVRILSEHPFIIRLQADLQTVARDIEMRYADYYEGIRTMCARTGKLDHVHGVALSYFCQDVEDACMRTVIKYLRKDCDDDMAKQVLWKYDGLMFPKVLAYGADGEQDDDTFLQSVQAAVYTHHNLHLVFTFKDISSPRESYQDCGVDLVVNAYQKWKKVFDMRYVKFLNPPRYGKLQDDGTYQLLSYGQGGKGGDFGYQTMEENQQFIADWVVDKDKRIYKGLRFAPPPAVPPAGYLNTFRGFAASRLAYDLSEDEIKEAAQPFLTHLQHMANGDDMAYTFFVKYLAHLFQKPGIKTEKIIFIRSIQGTGKDQLFNFIQMIAGKPLCHKATNVAAIKGQNSGNLEGRILLCMSECGFKDFQEAEFLKDLTNRTHFTVQMKYIPEYQGACFINPWMYSNQFCGMGMSMDNRRFVVMEANPRIAQVEEYHEPFARYIQDQENQYAVFKYLTSIDISGFFPGSCNTKTAVMRLMATQSPNYAASFLGENLDNWIEWADKTNNDYRRVSDDCIKISSSALIDAMRGFLQNKKGFEDKDTTQKITSWLVTLFSEAKNRMAQYCPEGITAISFGKESDKFRIGSGKKVRCYTLYIPAIQKFIHETSEDVGGQEDQEGNDVSFVPTGVDGVIRTVV